MGLKKLWTLASADHVLDVSWSANGSLLAITPSTGCILIADADGNILHELAEHGLSNGVGSWNGDLLASCGADGKIRIHNLRAAKEGAPNLGRGSQPDPSPPRELPLGRTWIEHAKWSPDGKHLGAGLGKSLLILDADGNKITEFADHKSTVCDFAWNPKNPSEIASVCDGGAHMWRLGEEKSFGRFDWGGASLIAIWSPDGRWVVTGDQTPSVHVYDFTRNHPLHIQGYETKVKALSFNATSTRLASGGGPLVTVWDCTGEAGPEGSVPKQIQGHAKDSLALAYHPTDDLLASGGQDGLLILFKPETRTTAVGLEKLKSAVTSVAWNPAGTHLAAGTEDGSVSLFTYTP